MTTILRKAAAGALSVLATGMSWGSRVAGQVAQRVGADGRASATGTSEPETADEVLEVIGQGRQTDAARRATVSEPPTEPVPDVPTHARTHETHIEELASQSAAEVIAAVPGLSTDELGRLYEYEAAHKKRKTVLAAVERAADPHTPEPMTEAGGVPTGRG